MNCVFDLDGTLASDEHRVRHLVQSPEGPDWCAYYAEMDADTLIEPVAVIARSLRIGQTGALCAGPAFDHFEIWTGRPERYRAITLRWLARHSIPFTALRMRGDNDYRPNHALKREWLDTMIEQGWTPDIVFEDAVHNVRMFRDRGILCVDVAGRLYGEPYVDTDAD